MCSRGLRQGGVGRSILLRSPAEALYAAQGREIALPEMELSILRGGFVPGKARPCNRDKISIWLPGNVDPFLAAGAYELTNGLS